MEFQPGAISLSQIAGGILASGVVPFPRFETDFQQMENAAPVDVAVDTTVNEVTTAAAKVGDRVLAFARMRILKGGVGGRTTNQIMRSAGPGGCNFSLEGSGRTSECEQVANVRWSETNVALGEVTIAGAMTFRQRQSSFGSNGTVNTGEACLSVWIIPGS